MFKKASNFTFEQIISNRNRDLGSLQSDGEFVVKSSDGTDVSGWFRETPSDKGTIFYLHGFTGNCGSSEPLKAVLAAAERHGLGFVAYDSRHHGLSGNSPPTFGTAESWDFQAVMNEAERRGLPRPYIGVGESLGAMAAQRTAVVDPRLAGVFLMHPPAWPMDALGVSLRRRLGLPLAALGTPSAMGMIAASYGKDMLSDGDVRRHSPHPDHEPLVLFVMGDRDYYGWQKTRQVYYHWYRDRPDWAGTTPLESPDARKWFVVVPDAVHPDDNGGYCVWHWSGFGELLSSFVDHCLSHS